MPCLTMPQCLGRAGLRTTALPRNRATIVRASKEEDIYIGKGKVIQDDPSKYPEKTQLTGGWAGGEVGLWQLRETAKQDGAAPAQAPSEGDPAGYEVTEAEWTDGRKVQARKVGSGDDTLYIGRGRFIQDDGTKYARKEDLGVFSGATGGFAGGERGLRQFIETGEISFTDGPARQGASPLAGGFLIAGLAVGALALQDSVEVVEKEAAGQAASLQLLQVGLAVGGLAFLVVLTSIITKKAATAVAETTEKAVKFGALGLAVAVVAKYILSN